MPYPATYPNEIFSVFAFLGFLCCAIPFPWHLEAWNTGTCLYMFWTGFGCLFQFINSIVWNRNAFNPAPVWCDITARFIIGCSWGVPAASLCINRRLYHIASVKSVTVSKAERYRAIMIDLAIGLGLPILGMILQYIPQGHRYNVFEDVGCFPFTYNTPVAFALVYCPPVIIGIVSGVYCVLSIRNFYKRHHQFAELLSGHSNLSSSRYIRLMALAATDVLLTVPLGSWALYLNVKVGVHRWLGWEDTHRGFSRVDQFPSIIWRTDRFFEIAMECTRWNVILCAFIFFAYFGFADEARKHYRSAVETVAKKVGYSTFTLTGTGTGVFASTGSKSGFTDSVGKIRPIPPINVHREMISSRHRSIDSFTNVSVDVNDTSYLEDKEKDFSPTGSYGAFSLSDVGGVLADYNSDSPSVPTSGSEASSVSSPTRSPSTSPSRASIREETTTLAVPTSTPPRHQSDVSPV